MNRIVWVSIVVLLEFGYAWAESGADPSGFLPLPEVAGATAPLQVQLGKKLYFEVKLSLAQDLSCNSCHRLDQGRFGVDNEATSLGHQGQRGDRNSPTVLNAALHIAQFWDGRAKDVEEQALGPVQNPVEMAMPSEAVVLERLKQDPEYPKLFAAAFPGEANSLTFINMGKAIGAFERQLLTPSRFDDYLRGDRSALTAQELKGLQTFKSSGCMACHNGATLGGQMYQKIGLIKPYQTADQGRFKVTAQEADRFVFKVPSLRNIEKTGPYFHDGSVKTLEEAVRLMGEHQLGRTFSSEEIGDIVVFLRSLTGRIPEIAKP